MDQIQSVKNKSNQVSIQSLLEDLCKSIYKDVNEAKDAIAQNCLYQPSGQQRHDNIPKELLTKCKKTAFEILLMKSNVKSVPINRALKDNGLIYDPVQKLRISRFEYDIFVGQMHPHFGPYGQIDARQEEKILKKRNRFKECMEFVEGNDYFCSEQSDGYAILWFLTLFTHNSSVDSMLKVDSYFPLALDQIPSLPTMEPKYFKLNWEPSEELQNNPYCAAMQRLSKRTNLFHLPSLMNATPAEQSIVKPRQKNIVQEVVDEVMGCVHKSEIYYEPNKWEHREFCIPLNKDTDPKVIASLFEKKFCTEMPDASMNIRAMLAAEQHQVFEARIIDKKVFNEHIKLLMIGIESESFMYNPTNMTFRLLDNLTIENTLPETVVHFVKDFIECGACYKQLKALISTNNFQLKCNGFVFKALCSSLDKYLETFRSAILISRDESLAGLMVRVSPLINQVRVLANLLRVHPGDNDQTISYGSEFLGYLYTQINYVTKSDVFAILVFILSQCCDVYFRRFSNWVYHGIIEDPGQELFIEFINYYKPKTKSFFDRAFTVKESSVPGFLKGWQHSILLCGKYSNLLKEYNKTHPLFNLTPPKITVCLSFAQIRAVQAECKQYELQARSACGHPFIFDDLKQQRQEKRLELAKVVAERSKQNLEQWKAEQEKKAALRQEKHDRDRLYLMRQIEEIRARKLEKRREEVEVDREFIRQSEMANSKLAERENEQLRKNIECYKELTHIVDAQQERIDAENSKLKSKLLCTDANDELQNAEKNDKTLINIEKQESDNDESDTESVYFDADKSLTSTTSGKSFQSPEYLKTPEDIFESTEGTKKPVALPRSASDLVNSNGFEDLSLDRARNRANVLNSNIDLAAGKQITQTVKIPSGSLTEAQKNKLKMLQQEYSLVDTNANAEPVTIQAAPVQLTELQKNRNKVLASEFGITEAIVNVPTENQGNSDFERIKKMAQGHCHTFDQLDEVNGNELRTDSHENKQDHEMNTDTRTSNEATTLRNKLKASLSLELDNARLKPNVLAPKACQSDFVVSPMSTTSDELVACSMTESQIDRSISKINEELNGLTLDCSIAEEKQVDVDQFLGEFDDHPTPLSSLNTAGIEKRFNFDVPYKIQPTFSQILRPSSTSNSIFDISSRLSATRNNKATPPSPVNQSSKSLTKSELQDLISGNLEHFLEQSFIIPLSVYSKLLNNEILKIFFEELDILGHFQSLRNYYFMMDGEFASNICDGILNELNAVRKPSDIFNTYALHSILERALQASQIGHERNAEKLSFCITNIPEKLEMSSPNLLIDLHLQYKVDWPLNLLLSKESIDHYDKVFQHLLKLRRITWLLDESLCKLKDIRKQSAQMIQSSAQFRHIQQIRHKLLCFVNALQNHITSIAIEGSWQKFQEDLKTVKSMEDLYQKHKKYLKQVKFLCMLNKSSNDFYVQVEDVFVVIIRFCTKLQSKSWTCKNGVYSHPNYEKLLKIEEDFTNLIKFIIYAGNKMSQSGYQAEIGEFIYMININGFYDSL